MGTLGAAQQRTSCHGRERAGGNSTELNLSDQFLSDLELSVSNGTCNPRERDTTKQTHC